MASTKKGNLLKPDLNRENDSEIWFRFSVFATSQPKFTIYTSDVTPALVETLDVGGDVPPGIYASRGRAFFWDKTDSGSDPVGPGLYYLYFYLDNVLQNSTIFSLT
jgi:hypothetical protein